MADNTGDKPTRYQVLQHYVPANSPKSPYTQVKISSGKASRGHSSHVGDATDGAGAAAEEVDESDEGTFEIVSLPDEASDTFGDDSSSITVQAENPSSSPSLLSRIASRAPSVSGTRKSKKTQDNVRIVSQEVAAQRGTSTGSGVVQPDDSLYEPIEVGKNLEPFESTVPKTGRASAASSADLRCSNIGTIKMLTPSPDMEESFEYQPVEVISENSVERSPRQAPDLPKSPRVSRLKNLPDDTADSFDYQPVEVMPTLPRVEAEQDYISPSDIPRPVDAGSMDEEESSDHVESTSTLTTNNLYSYALQRERYSVRSVASRDSHVSRSGSEGSAGSRETMTSDGYVVSDKEFRQSTRRGQRLSSTSASGRPAMPLPTPGTMSNTLPTRGSYMEFDSRDQPDVPSSLPNTSTLQQQKGKGKSRSQSNSSTYQALVKPEHFLPSATYYERLMDVSSSNRKHRMAMLPPIAADLPANEQVRHRIVQHLLETEQSYIKTLKMLLDTYAPAISGLPSRPGLVSLVDKLSTFFSTVQKIFSLHHMFKIGLSGPVSDWNAKQKIGPVFEGAFSKAMAIEVYSEYIEQFASVLVAIQKGRRTQRLFQEVVRCCDDENGLRLNLESLLLRPVQRFPQFLLILQDLLGNTEKDHPDRVPLQLALTRIEHVTEQLNQRKRLSDQLSLVDRLRNRIMSLPVDMFQDKFRLISQDEVCQVKIKQGRAVWKKRCLFLFCSQLVCTSVLQPNSPFIARNPDEYGYKFKWRKNLNDISIIASDLDSDTAAARVVAERFKGSTAQETVFPLANGGDLALQLRHERATLQHDMKMMSKIAALIATLRQDRPPITMPAVQEAAQAIQTRLTVVEEELRRCEAYRLDIALNDSGSSSRVNHVSFVMSSPSARFSWVKKFNRTKLMMSEATKPSWSVMDSGSGEDNTAVQASVCALETPMLVNSVPVMLTLDSMALELGIEVCVPNTVEGMPQYSPPYVWVCSNGGAQAAQISIVAGINIHPVVVECFQCVQSRVLSMICVPGKDCTITPKRAGTDTGEESTSIWVGTQSKTILVFKAGMSDARMPTARLKCVDSVLCLEYFNEYRFAGLADGSVIMFFKNSKGQWDSNSCSRLVLTSEPVTCATVFSEEIFFAAGLDIHVVSTISKTIVQTFPSTEKRRDVEGVYGMLSVGIGLWLFHRHGTAIKLLHAETKDSIQEFDIQATIKRHQSALNLSDGSVERMYVTKLEHSPGKLWVGTSCGVVALLPVPRLGGVPRVLGSALLSHHGHSGPVRIIVPVTSIMELSLSDKAVEYPDEHNTVSPSPMTSPPPGSATTSPPPELATEKPASSPPPLPPDNASLAAVPEDSETSAGNPYDNTPEEEKKEETPGNIYDITEEESLYEPVEPYQNLHTMGRGEHEEEDYLSMSGEGGKQAQKNLAARAKSKKGATVPTVPEVDDRPYSKLHGHATLPSTVVNPDHKKSNEEIYSSLFDHTEAIDPIASIEERRRQTQRRKNKERIVVEQHYIVCGGIGVRYHSRWAGKDRMTSDEGGQLLVWELHHD